MGVSALPACSIAPWICHRAGLKSPIGQEQWQIADIPARLQEADRGEFATAEEMRAGYAKHGHSAWRFSQGRHSFARRGRIDVSKTPAPTRVAVVRYKQRSSMFWHA